MRVYGYQRKQILKSQNKYQEACHFELFKTCCGDLPLSNHIKHDDNPDFLIEHSAGILGIELTQLFKVTKHPNAPQALESFRRQILESAQECYKGIPPLMVRVWFNFNQTVPKNRTSEIKRISQSLAEIVKKWHYENPYRYHEILKSPLDNSNTFFSISIIRSRNPHWVVNNVALQQDFSSFSIEKIQSRIDEKNLLYEKYITKCDECWLLIIGNLFKDSQSFEIPNQIDHKFKSKFKRTYYMDASHRKDLRELPTIRI